MIPEIVGFVTRREGRKFRSLNTVDDSLLSAERLVKREDISLYVHIPFCRSLCPFCCFNRYLFREDLARRYFIDLKQELETYRGLGFGFRDVYFGGGTPTVLMDELGDFIGQLRKQFKIKQISLETTPRELSAQNIKLLREYGINRLSIGVQSFDAQVLKTMGRVNGPAEEVKDRLLKCQGQFDTLNADFVFNFPDQTTEQFAADVAAFKELGIDQATLYPLMASPHKKDDLERQFNRVDNSREKKFYEIILKELYHGDYTPSTAWCFSRGERMIDEYIIESDDYIGIGAGSVSIVGGSFYVNSFSLEHYHELIVSGRLPVVGWRNLSEKEKRRYYLLTKFFGLKLDKEAYRRRFGGDIGSQLRLELAFFRSFGLVAGDDILHITEKGMYPVSVMMREFFGALNALREYHIEHQI
jgi:coproporphyrinogen III oxidase-like Fe-S oxidoreductase